MHDLISRQAAIDKFEPWLKVRGYSEGELNMLKAVLYELRILPSAQPEQPEIIRCKDCKNWDMTWTNDFSPNYHYCPMVDGVRKEDWFCADAEERRTE